MKKTRKTIVKTPKTTSLDQLPNEVLEIFTATARVYKIVPEILWQKTRKQEIVDARHSAIAIIYDNYGKYIENRGYTLNRIGGFFNRDHTTVLHAIETAQNRCLTEDLFLQKYEAIQDAIHVIGCRPRLSKFINILDELTTENAIRAEKWLQDILLLQNNPPKENEETKQTT